MSGFKLFPDEKDGKCGSCERFVLENRVKAKQIESLEQRIEELSQIIEQLSQIIEQKDRDLKEYKGEVTLEMYSRYKNCKQALKLAVEVIKFYGDPEKSDWDNKDYFDDEQLLFFYENHTVDGVKMSLKPMPTAESCEEYQDYILGKRARQFLESEQYKRVEGTIDVK